MMHGAETVAEQTFPAAVMVPPQQSLAVRPGPRREQPAPPQVPQPAEQQILPDETPGSPLLQVDAAGTGVGSSVRPGVGAGVGSGSSVVGAGVVAAIELINHSIPR